MTINRKYTINREMREYGLSKKNPYWIDTHRYLELRHFCMQYHEWKHMLNALDGIHSNAPSVNSEIHTNTPSDPTGGCAAKREKYAKLVKLVEDAAKDTDAVLAPYILAYVTENIVYDSLNARERIPVCRTDFYRAVRKYLWLLSERRG